LQVYGINVHDYGALEIRGSGVKKCSGAVDPEAVGKIVQGKPDSQELDDAELEDIVLRARYVIAALGSMAKLKPRWGWAAFD
jgi:hypothetical protein